MRAWAGPPHLRALPATSGDRIAAPAVWLRSSHVRHLQQEVEEKLLTCADTGDAWTSEICGHLLRAGGKRLRPSLLLLAAEFGDAARSQVVDGAAGMELLHVATLYHDDVSDEASCRRGRSSANRLWGNRAAVLAGTFLFARAMERIAACGEEAIGMASSSLAEVWKGQARETENVDNLELDQRTYLEIVKGKTAALCELPCRLGAHLAGLDEESTRALASYGRSIGIAFQVADDILDVIGNEAVTGKPRGLDLSEGIYTQPVLDALHTPPYGERLRELLCRTDRDRHVIDDTRRLVEASGAVERARQLARHFAAQAVASLRGLPADAARRSLRALANEVANRAGAKGMVAC